MITVTPEMIANVEAKTGNRFIALVQEHDVVIDRPTTVTLTYVDGSSEIVPHNFNIALRLHMQVRAMAQFSRAQQAASLHPQAGDVQSSSSTEVN